MNVIIKVITTGPKNAERNRINFTKWDIYKGMTEEQENFFKQTYVDYISNTGKTKQKHVYFCQN